VKFRRLRRSKAAWSLSYVEYRSNTNAVMSWNTGYTNRRSSMGGVGKLRTWIRLIHSRLLFTPIRMATIKNTKDTKCWWGYREKDPHTLLVESKLVQPPWKRVEAPSFLIIQSLLSACIISNLM
jgi:hypothetical protein